MQSLNLESILNNADSSATLPLLLLLFSIVFLIVIKQKSSRKLPLPPGPRPWPIVGNLPQLGKKMHVSMADLAKTHGGLMSLRLGTQLVIVGSSPEAATEILKTHDKELCGRHVPMVSFATDPKLNKDSIAWSYECGKEWMAFRALMRTELFSTKIVETQYHVREKNVRAMVDYLSRKQGELVAMRDVVYIYTFNTLGNVYFTRDFMDFDGEEGRRVSALVREMMELWSAPNISDLYPILSRFDLQGLRKKADVCVKKMCDLWDHSIRERREIRGKSRHDSSDLAPKNKDFLDILLESGFDDEQISYIFLELLAAVSDGSTSTVEWALSEMVKNPEAMKKARQELSEQISESFVTESQLPKLPYLHACIKETLRLHPPAPVLLPRRAAQDLEIMNHTIPKNAQVLVNVWAIARDEKIWKDPMSFKPERFINSSVDYKGNDFEYLPFGAGRRICAGLPMATRQVLLALANLIHQFEWSLPDNLRPEQLDMEELFGVTLLKENPLALIPKRKF